MKNIENLFVAVGIVVAVIIVSSHLPREGVGVGASETCPHVESKNPCSINPNSACKVSTYSSPQSSSSPTVRMTKLATSDLMKQCYQITATCTLYDAYLIEECSN